MATVTHPHTVVVTTSNGASRGVRQGDVIPDDDPIVREFPWLFEAAVEQATAAPGEKRSVRRRRTA